MEKTDIAVIGGGIVGGSVARQFALERPDLSVLIVEANDEVGVEASANNAGALHSGIHEGHGSLRSELCVEGQSAAVEYCEEHEINSFRKTGMLIIKSAMGSSEEWAENDTNLDLLRDNAQLMVLPFTMLNPDGVKEIEPLVESRGGIYLPDVWLVDPSELTKSIIEDAQLHGVGIRAGARLFQADTTSEGIVLETEQGHIQAETVINAAGLGSDEVAAMLGFPKYEIFPTRGEYWQITTEKYQSIGTPVNQTASKLSGKGMHLSPRDGTLYIGPDRTLTTERRNVQEQRSDAVIFSEGARRFLPEIGEEDIKWGYAGVRARNTNPESASDFIVGFDSDQVCNIIGIESPGLTAALGIGRYVVREYASVSSEAR